MALTTRAYAIPDGPYFLGTGNRALSLPGSVYLQDVQANKVLVRFFGYTDLVTPSVLAAQTGGQLNLSQAGNASVAIGVL